MMINAGIPEFYWSFTTMQFHII